MSPAMLPQAPACKTPILPCQPLFTSPFLMPARSLNSLNSGESEFRELSAQELAHLKTASVPLEGHVCRVGDLQAPVLAVLLRKGLVSVEVCGGSDGGGCLVCLGCVCGSVSSSPAPGPGLCGGGLFHGCFVHESRALCP